MAKRQGNQKKNTSYDPGFAYFDNTGNHTIPYGSTTGITNYDYGSGSPGAVLRQTNTTYSWQSGTNAAIYLSANILRLPTSVVVTDGTNKCSETDYAYDDGSRLSAPNPPLGASQQHLSAPNSVRGNLSSEARWVSSTPCQAGASGTMVSAYTNMYDTGVVYQQIDPLTHPTTYTYSSSYVGALPTQVQNALLQNTNYTYDFNTGLVTGVTDSNSQTTTFDYDALLRVKTLKFPSQGAQGQGETDLAYNESSLPFSVTRTTKVTTSPVLNLIHKTVVDGLGRVIQKQLISDAQGTDIVDIGYDAVGYKTTESRPYRSQTETTYGVTTSNYDALGRGIKTIPPDGTANSNNVATSYSNFPLVTVTDQAGASRTSQVDGLGRLIAVWEDPTGFNFQTVYQYDGLGNLLCVEQHGGVTGSGCSSPPSSDATSPWRVRRFSYDSRSLLLSATNPESGAISYSYNNDGVMMSKLSPLPNKIPADTSNPQTITTTYTPDSLHRTTAIAYSDGTPSVTYEYDGVLATGCTPPTLTDTYPVGRKTGMCDGSGTTSWAHDPLGATLTEKRKIGTKTKTTGYTYNLDSSIATLSYPSGRTITYTPGGAGHSLEAKDIANGINYVTGATYAPFGALTGALNGASSSGITTTNTYDNRLQPMTLQATASSQTVFSVNYDFHRGVNDNGNIFQIGNTRDTTRTQNFTYDALNRVAAAITQGTTGTTCWGQRFGHLQGTTFVSGIDAWGNLNEITATQCSAPVWNQATTLKNQIVGFCHDLAGNPLGQSGCPGLPYVPTYTYDGANRLKGLTGGPTYAYDGDGKRVQKSSGMLYWTGAGSDTLTETNLSGTPAADYI